MNIQIYKYTLPIQASIEYFIYDKDCSGEIALGPDDLFLRGLAISSLPEGLYSILSTLRPLNHLKKNTTESSFLDLLVVTGISKAMMEFIFANFPLESFSVTIRPNTPAYNPSSGLCVAGTSMNSSAISVSSGNGSAMTINSSSANGITIHQSNII